MAITRFQRIPIRDTREILIDGESTSTKINVQFDWNTNNIKGIKIKITNGTKVAYVLKSAHICKILEPQLCSHLLELYFVREQPQEDDYEIFLDLNEDELCMKRQGSFIFTKIIIFTKEEYQNIENFRCKSFTYNFIGDQPETKDGAVVVSI